MRLPQTATETIIATAASILCAVVFVRGVAPSQPTLPTSAPVARPRAEAGRNLPRAEPSRFPWLPTEEVIGPEFDSDASMPDAAPGVADYTLHATLDPVTHVIDSQGVITWTNRSRASVEALFVHAYMNAFRDDRSTFMSQRVAGSRGTGRLGAPGGLDVSRFAVREMGGVDLWPSARNADDANPDDATDMRLALPRAVEPGETIHIDVAFRTRLPAVIERTGYHGSFHMAGQWFPKIARLEPDGTFAHFPYRHLAEYYADFGTYDVTIDVPEGFEVGATGARVSDATEHGRRVVRHVQPNVHDFAFTAFDGFRTLERDGDGVKVRCLVPHGYERIGEHEVDAAIYGLRQYGAAYGAYPYASLTIVHPPDGAGEAGGMEYPTLITTGGSWYTPSQAGWARSLTLHELGHQYFYGFVATNEEAWPFLDEGLATYAELEALDDGWGPGALFSIGWLHGGTDGLLRNLGLAAGHDDLIAQRADDFVSGRSYGLLAYARAALVMRTLDRAYEPGAMKRAVGRYARRYRFDHPDPSHLLGAVRDTIGDAAEHNLRTAVFERGWVDYAVADASCLDTRGACELVVTRRGTLAFPVDIEIGHNDGTTTRVRWDGEGRQRSLPIDSDSGIQFVLIDPERRILLDEDLANNAMTLGRPRRAWRVWDRASYLAAVVLGSVSP